VVSLGKHSCVLGLAVLLDSGEELT
jgi:hypothetical protein